jgi:hypothetical protein
MAEIKREVTFEIALTEDEATKLVENLDWLRDDNRLHSVLYPLLEELKDLV